MADETEVASKSPDAIALCDAISHRLITKKIGEMTFKKRDQIIEKSLSGKPDLYDDAAKKAGISLHDMAVGGFDWIHDAKNQEKVMEFEKKLFEVFTFFSPTVA